MWDDLIAGRNAVMEQIMNNPAKIERVFLVENCRHKREITDLCIEKKIPFKIIETSKIPGRFARFRSKSIFAIISVSEILGIDHIMEQYRDNNKTIMVLFDRVTNVGNAGAVIRSGMAFGIRDFIFEQNQCVSITAVLSTSSSGYSSLARLYRISSPSSLVNKLKKEDVYIVSLDMSGTDIRKWRIQLPMLLIIGGEEKGIRRPLMDSSDTVLRIPTQDTVDSLNVSNASSIALYEIYNRINIHE